MNNLLDKILSMFPTVKNFVESFRSIFNHSMAMRRRWRESTALPFLPNPSRTRWSFHLEGILFVVAHFDRIVQFVREECPAKLPTDLTLLKRDMCWIEEKFGKLVSFIEELQCKPLTINQANNIWLHTKKMIFKESSEEMQTFQVLIEQSNKLEADSRTWQQVWSISTYKSTRDSFSNSFLHSEQCFKPRPFESQFFQ